MHARAAIVFITLPFLAACADEATRRDYIYKPAYCLASGLAALSNEQCMPQQLKDDAAAVASAKLAEPAAPGVAKHVYYTEDQRLAMGLTIAQAMFTPNEKLTRSSVTISLEANDLIPAADKTTCGRNATRDEAISAVTARITEKAINRETAKFLSEHYSDLQLSELYRVAKANGTLDDVASDAFIIPDPKDAKKTVNIKPQSSRKMGGILSYTTSKTVSQTITAQRKPIEAEIAAITAKHDTACAPKPEPVKQEAATTPPPENATATPATTEVTAPVAPAPEGASK